MRADNMNYIIKQVTQVQDSEGNIIDPVKIQADIDQIDSQIAALQQAKQPMIDSLAQIQKIAPDLIPAQAAQSISL